MTSTKYDEVYDIVVAMAKAKMLMNNFKGDIELEDPNNLVSMGIEEFHELEEELKKEQNYMGVIEEVADILNFAVGAAYQAIQRYRNRKCFTTNMNLRRNYYHEPDLLKDGK